MNMEYQIMTEPKKRVVVNNGHLHRIRAPEGVNVIDLVRDGMALYPSSVEGGSKAVGLHRDTYSFIRKMLLLKARQVTHPDEEMQLTKALNVVNETRSLADAKRIASPIVEKYWVKHTSYGEHRYRGLPATKAAHKRRKRLENTLFAIREACTNNDELEIPTTMSRHAREEMVNTLSESIGSLTLLKQKLMGEQK